MANELNTRTRFITRKPCPCGVGHTSAATAFHGDTAAVFGDLCIVCRGCGKNRGAQEVRGKVSHKHQCGAKCLASTGPTCECSCGGTELAMRRCEGCNGPGPCLWARVTGKYLCESCHSDPSDDYFRHRAGRPVSTGSASTKPVVYRVTAAQRAELEAEAARLGLSSADLAAKLRAFPVR